MNINLINLKNQQNEFISINSIFTKCCQFSTIFTHLKKTSVSREKLNNLQLANDSTPLNRAFFVRKIRTPKENALSVLFSMVGRIGQRLGVGCLPVEAVSHPDTLYRQAVRSKAVDMKNLQLELSQMLYKFILLGKNRLKIAIRAKSEDEARQQLNLSKNQALFIGQINTRGRYV